MPDRRRAIKLGTTGNNDLRYAAHLGSAFERNIHPPVVMSLKDQFVEPHCTHIVISAAVKPERMKVPRCTFRRKSYGVIRVPVSGQRDSRVCIDYRQDRHWICEFEVVEIERLSDQAIMAERD